MRLRNREVTPNRPVRAHADSLTRVRFYHAWDHKGGYPRVSARALFTQFNLPKSTAYRWLDERREIGEKSSRRRDGRIEKQLLRSAPGPGRPRKIPLESLKDLLNKDKETRTQKLMDQINALDIRVTRRTVQRALHAIDAGMFKAATQKPITEPQAVQRKDYTGLHQHKEVVGFCDGVQFTDEAHMTLDDFPIDWILRYRGMHEHPNNVVSRSDVSANVVHMASWVNYYRKGILTFYNDEYDDYVAPKPEPKPRRRPTTENEQGYQQRVREWEARKAREPEITRPGNSMRASYYVEKILPIHCNAYESLTAQSDELRSHVSNKDRYSWYLMEDNDPSHGTKNPDSLPAVYRRQRGVVSLKHPANSPDLNPIEGLWNIIKERVKQYLHTINGITELKAALQKEWEKIDQESIQQRIDEMPDRCKQVFLYPEVRYKGAIW